MIAKKREKDDEDRPFFVVVVVAVAVVVLMGREKMSLSCALVGSSGNPATTLVRAKVKGMVTSRRSWAEMGTKKDINWLHFD